MPDPADREPRFELIVPAEAGHVGTVRLFSATVARTLGADDETVEDLKLAISEVATAIVMSGNSDQVRIEATADGSCLTIVIGPVTAGDMIDGSIHPIDVVLAMFPDATDEPAASVLVIPVPLGNSS